MRRLTKPIAPQPKQQHGVGFRFRHGRSVQCRSRQQAGGDRQTVIARMKFPADLAPGVGQKLHLNWPAVPVYAHQCCVELVIGVRVVEQIEWHSSPTVSGAGNSRTGSDGRYSSPAPKAGISSRTRRGCLSAALLIARNFCMRPAEILSPTDFRDSLGPVLTWSDRCGIAPVATLNDVIFGGKNGKSHVATPLRCLHQ